MSNKYERLSAERKDGQHNGTIPPWVTTAAYQLFKSNYQHSDFTMVQQLDFIADAAAEHMKETAYYDKAKEKFRWLLQKGFLSCSSPVLANMGTSRGMPVSCSGGVIEDSVEDLYSALQEAAVLTKEGFGTSSYLGGIRPRGSAISTGGKSSGVLPVFKLFRQCMQDISQGGVRRGSWAAYIEPEHGDFDELVDYILANPEDSNIGFIYSSDFIALLNSGDQEANRKHKRILRMRVVASRGYIFKVDEANKQAPRQYKKHGLSVKASNLCVSGDCFVATEHGMITVRELANQASMRVRSCERMTGGWKYPELKTALPIHKGKAAVVNVILSNGHSLTVTPDHLLATIGGDYIKANGSVGSELMISINVDGGKSMLCSYAKVVRVVEKKEEVDVYDLNVDDTPNFFVGDDDYCSFLVHNCSEITLHASENETFSCILSSLVLSRYDDWEDTDAIFWSTVFLDCICSNFIKRASSNTVLTKLIAPAVKGRALGLGVMGLHTLFQKRGIAYESLEAHLLNIKVFSKIDKQSLAASMWLAKVLGEPEWCKGTGVRNTHRTAIAPNKSSSVTQGGCSEGMNPDPAMVFTQLTAGGEMQRIAPELYALMVKRGEYNKKNVRMIADAFGSVQGVDWLSDSEKEVFKTAFEIDQHVVIRMGEARQQFICQSQSLNLFFNASDSEEYIAAVHQAGIESSLISLYYVATNTGIHADRGECLACEG